MSDSGKLPMFGSTSDMSAAGTPNQSATECHTASHDVPEIKGGQYRGNGKQGVVITGSLVVTVPRHDRYQPTHTWDEPPACSKAPVAVVRQIVRIPTGARVCVGEAEAESVQRRLALLPPFNLAALDPTTHDHVVSCVGATRRSKVWYRAVASTPANCSPPHAWSVPCPLLWPMRRSVGVC